DEDVRRVPRRTPMACQFCRGRKLKCDGGRPSCGNCNRRGYPCQYVPVYAYSSSFLHPRHADQVHSSEQQK
ncbi:hypothetical protein PISMIDRAFT_97140, partial [Pisolithus microcarpus 441]